MATAGSVCPSCSRAPCRGRSTGIYGGTHKIREAKFIPCESVHGIVAPLRGYASGQALIGVDAAFEGIREKGVVVLNHKCEAQTRPRFGVNDAQTTD